MPTYTAQLATPNVPHSAPPAAAPSTAPPIPPAAPPIPPNIPHDMVAYPAQPLHINWLPVASSLHVAKHCWLLCPLANELAKKYCSHEPPPGPSGSQGLPFWQVAVSKHSSSCPGSSFVKLGVAWLFNCALTSPLSAALTIRESTKDDTRWIRRSAAVETWLVCHTSKASCFIVGNLMGIRSMVYRGSDISLQCACCWPATTQTDAPFEVSPTKTVRMPFSKAKPLRNVLPFWTDIQRRAEPFSFISQRVANDPINFHTATSAPRGLVATAIVPGGVMVAWHMARSFMLKQVFAPSTPCTLITLASVDLLMMPGLRALSNSSQDSEAEAPRRCRVQLTTERSGRTISKRFCPR